MSIPKHFKEQFDRSTDDQLRDIIKSYGIDRPEGAYCVTLLQHRLLERASEHIQSMAKPHWVVTLTLIFTALCFVASSVAAWPVIQAWFYRSP